MDRDAREATTAGAKPAPHYPPVVVNRADRASRSRLRVVLLNAAGGRRLGEIAVCLKRAPLNDADVILLCEANLGMKGTPWPDVAGELAAMLEMSYAYIPEFALKTTGGELVAYLGNAILTSAPFEHVEAVAMHNPRVARASFRRKRRWSRVGTPTGLIARVRFGGEAMAVGVAHLHSRCAPAERARQMATYMASFPATGRAIFGGDLNTTTIELSSWGWMLGAARHMITNPRRFRAPQHHEPSFDHLRERGLETEGVNVADRATFTFSGLIPVSMRPKLDWLAVRELRPIVGTAAVVAPRSSIFSGRASDHDFVTVDLEL
jgi:endonuclease/exonuclease/phosphatase family metal-dependent hydrolase